MCSHTCVKYVMCLHRCTIYGTLSESEMMWVVSQVIFMHRHTDSVLICYVFTYMCDLRHTQRVRNGCVCCIDRIACMNELVRSTECAWVFIDHIDDTRDVSSHVHALIHSFSAMCWHTCAIYAMCFHTCTIYAICSHTCATYGTLGESEMMWVMYSAPVVLM